MVDKKNAGDWNWALSKACYGNHQDIIDWLIDTKGANNFGKAFIHACQGGHRDLAEWLLTKFDTTVDHHELFQEALVYAILATCHDYYIFIEDREDIMEWLIVEKGANDFENIYYELYYQDDNDDERIYNYNDVEEIYNDLEKRKVYREVLQWLKKKDARYNGSMLKRIKN